MKIYIPIICINESSSLIIALGAAWTSAADPITLRAGARLI